MNFLQKALAGNAIFSALSGVILILFNKPIYQAFAVENTTICWILGMMLLYFAATVGYEVSKQRPLFVKWIILQDLIWVAASAYLLWVQPLGISKLGNIWIGMVATLVLVFAVLQSLGLKKIIVQNN